MTDETPPLPETWQSLLDEPTLRALFDNIGGHAELLDVRTKGGETAMSGVSVTDLNALHDALLDGSLFGVLLKYRHDGAEWWDTLTRTPQGIQLFRIKPPA